MTTRCLRLIHSPICQFIRYASTSAKSSRPPRARSNRRTTQSGGEKSRGVPRGPGNVPVQATYEPSPIFGTVKRKPKEALSAQVTELNKARLKSKSKKTTEEKPKAPLTEDEKQYLYKSFRLKTSVKKLGNLTRQIAHKDIDYAITQMRFSPKRAARNIFRGLEHAKEEAIRLQDMKQGQIIVDQAWVGRDAYKKQLWPRARGRVNIRMRPYTHFTVLLRTAETVNKQIAKVKQRKLESLVRRPSEMRPIYNARPYYTW